MEFVHEDCILKWFHETGRGTCELCHGRIPLKQMRLPLKQIVKRTLQHLAADKKRILKLLGYMVYLWFLKFKVYHLLKAYVKLLFKMSPLTMLKSIYNPFIVLLLIQVGLEEYERIKKVVAFFKHISWSTRISKSEDA